MIAYKVFLGCAIVQKTFCRGHSTAQFHIIYYKSSHIVEKRDVLLLSSSCTLPFCSPCICCQMLVAPASSDQTSRAQFSWGQEGKGSHPAASVSLGLLQVDGGRMSCLEMGTWHPGFREDLVSGAVLATEVQLCVCVSARGWGQQFVRTLEKQVMAGENLEIQPCLPHSGNERRERGGQEMVGADPSSAGTYPTYKILWRCLSLV